MAVAEVAEELHLPFLCSFLLSSINVDRGGILIGPSRELHFFWIWWRRWRRRSIVPLPLACFWWHFFRHKTSRA